MLFKKKKDRGILGWCLFDAGHSAFAAVITTFVYSTYFVTAVAPNETEGTALWGWALGGSGLVIALLAPILGAIADRKGNKKSWNTFFMAFSILFSVLLFFTYPSAAWMGYGLIIFFFANISIECLQVFYNALLVDLAPPGKIGRISGWGWGTGYFGGLVCLIICLCVIKCDWFTEENAFDVRLTNIVVAVWMLALTIPFLMWVPNTKSSEILWREAVRQGFKELQQTFRRVRSFKYTLRFLVARLFYMDGVNTLLAFAGVYAAGCFGFSMSDILLFAIFTNAVAGVGACAFGWLDDMWGPKRVVVVSLVALTGFGVGLLLTHSVLWFWILGLFFSIFVGPIQAASRSYMARLTPPELVGEMFGIFALSGKVTSFIGPLCVGTLTSLFSSQRIGLSIVLMMMFIGLIIMLKVPAFPEKESVL